MRIFMFIGLLLYTYKCSIIHDATTYSGIHMSEYCPEMKYCASGSHVMCMYYVPGKRWGPECHGTYDNVTLNPKLIERILKNVNNMRSKLAMGVETGKQEVLFPHAKGVLRLKWDDELAMFAQVIANQCVLRHDLCRASYRFPDPGQAAARYRYTYPDWKQVRQRHLDNNTGLTMERIERAIDSSIRNWHSTKRTVTTDMLLSAPEFDRNGTPIYYLEMIYGSATHMGCGISASLEYQQYPDLNDLIYNTINLFCNFSTRPKTGEPYVNVTPTDTRCGCPEGTYEDADCLCNEKKSCEATIQKPPPVVVLPIVSYEDAPQSNLAVLERSAKFITSGKTIINKIRPFKRLESAKEENYRIPEVLAWRNNTRLKFDESGHANWNHFKKNVISRTRALDEHEEDLEKLAHLADKYGIGLETSIQHSSSFDKPQLFRLPDRSVKTYMHNHDVKHRSMISDDPAKIIRDAITNQSLFLEDEKKGSYYNLSDISEEKRKIHEDNKRQHSDHKLLHLLEILEHEINHFIFDDKKKKELQTKILKILENVDRNHKDIIQSDRDQIMNHRDSKHIQPSVKIIDRRPQEFIKSRKDTQKHNPYMYYLSDNDYPKSEETTSNLYRAVIDDEFMNNLKKSNLYINDDLYDDNLSYERRNFYEAKLNAIRKKLDIEQR